MYSTLYGTQSKSTKYLYRGRECIGSAGGAVNEDLLEEVTYKHGDLDQQFSTQLEPMPSLLQIAYSILFFYIEMKPMGNITFLYIQINQYYSSTVIKKIAKKNHL